MKRTRQSGGEGDSPPPPFLPAGAWTVTAPALLREVHVPAAAVHLGSGGRVPALAGPGIARLQIVQRPAVFGDEYRGVGEGKTLAALCVLRVEAVLLLFRQFVNPVREPDVLIPHKGAGVITAGSGFQHSSFVGVRPRLDDFLPALAPVRDGGVSLESGELRLVVPKAHVVENADGGDPKLKYIR